MEIVTILIALGLAMDSFSVSITRGLTNSQTRIPAEAIQVAFFFGLFQAIMPILGWWAGILIIVFISGFDHWIAFGLLTFIGLRMIYETAYKESMKMVSSSNISVLLMLSIATSIDALAVGFSLSFLEVSIITPAIIIGMITFSLSFLGVYIGKKLGRFFKNIGVLGGVILLFIGVNILVEHIGILI